MFGHASPKIQRRKAWREVEEFRGLFLFHCYQLLDRIDLSADTDPDYPVKSATEFILQLPLKASQLELA